MPYKMEVVGKSIKKDADFLAMIPKRPQKVIAAIAPPPTSAAGNAGGTAGSGGTSSLGASRLRPEAQARDGQVKAIGIQLIQHDSPLNRLGLKS